MKREYVRLEIDLGDLGELNAFASVGFRVVCGFDEDGPATTLILEPHRAHYVLLERELQEPAPMDPEVRVWAEKVGILKKSNPDPPVDKQESSV